MSRDEEMKFLALYRGSIGGRYKIVPLNDSNTGSSPLSDAKAYSCLGGDERTGQRVLLRIAFKARDEQNLLAHEYSVGAALSHVNIVRYFDFVEEGYVRVLVTEVLDRRSFLEDPKHARLRSSTFQPPMSPLFHQLQDGLDYLHARGIVHANLNPDSAWLDGRGTLKIGNLWYAVTPSSPGIATSDHARVLYGSPEHLTGEMMQESDYFSVGMLLYESVTGRHPFWERGPLMLFRKLQTTDVDKALSAAGRMGKKITLILRALLSPYVSERHDGWRLLRDHQF